MLRALLCSARFQPFFPSRSSQFQFSHGVPLINIQAFIVALNAKARNDRLFRAASFFAQIPQLVTFYILDGLGARPLGITRKQSRCSDDDYKQEEEIGGEEN